MTKRIRSKKRLTKRERKAETSNPGRAAAASPARRQEHAHIHCVACGAHLNEEQFTGRPSTARWIRCRHGTRYACCADCGPEAQRRLDEHDRTGQPVWVAGAWH